MALKYVAVEPSYLSSGTSIGDEEMTLSAIQDRDGNTLTMTDFGSIGFGVISPKTSREEQFTFSGISGNDVTGIKHVTMKSPYTETAGFTKAHSAGEKVILYTDSPALLNKLASKINDETITGEWTFTEATRPVLSADLDTTNDNALVTRGQLSRTSFSGTTDATTSSKGIVELGTQTEVDSGTAIGSTGAALAVTPNVLRARQYHNYLVDSGTVNAIAITPSPAVTSYAAGDHYIIKVANTITSSAVTLNVASLGAKTVLKQDQSSPTSSDIVANGIYEFVYDGTNFQLITQSACTFSATAGEAITAGQPLHIGTAYQSDGGIGFDNSAAASLASVTNPTASFTVGSNSNRILLVAVGTSGSTPSSVTYNGVAMTLDQSLTTEGAWFVYKLVAPTTGSNTLSITCTGVQSYILASYYNVSQSTGVEASSIGTASSSSPYESSITTISSGAAVHHFGFIHFFGGTAPTAPVCTYTSKYCSDLSSTSASSAVGSAFASGNTSGARLGTFIEAQTVKPYFYSSGSGNYISYSCSLAPATAPTTAVFKADTTAATNNPPRIDFIGFAGSSASAGGTVSIITSGKVSGLSGLTAGSTYYATNTAGTISTTRGSYAKVVGKALTTTTLTILTQPEYAVALSKGTTTNTLTAETAGLVYISSAATLTVDGITATTANTPLPVVKGGTYSSSSASPTIYFKPLS